MLRGQSGSAVRVTEFRRKRLSLGMVLYPVPRSQQFTIMCSSMKLRSASFGRFARSLFLFAVSVGAMSCVTAQGVGQTTGSGPTKQQSQVHLVVDVGSSGTSLCMFPVRIGAAGRRCAVGNIAPVCAKSKGGLATLTLGKSPAAIAELVQSRLRTAWDSLADPAKGGHPQWRAQVQAAAALGTGGFRDPVSGQSLTRPEWTGLWQSVQQFFLQEAAIASVVARPITGSEEGQLAWQGVRESEQPSERFAIMEVGGATVQFATADGPSEQDPARVVAVSDGRGQDVTFERFADSLSTHPGFAVCYSPDHRERQNGSACIDFLFDRVFADSRVAGLAAVTPPRRVYALGAPWLGLLRELPSAMPWSIKSTRDLPLQVRLGDLRALADWVCPKSDRQLLNIAPHSYEAKRGAGRTCFSVAYHAAYFQAIGPAAMGTEVIPGGDEQWARGAASSDAFFAACRPASAK